mmetsp:Transcript_12007/g.27728  ORF Transcript_12007/g.27728 Transcript_12007/m.27728 type:complete len:385 (+) Transcript_12007:126-1280(+)
MENSMNVLQQINELSSTLDVQLNMEKRSQNADHRLIEIETQEKDGMDHAVVNQVKRLRSAMDVIRSGRCLEVTSSISIRETSIDFILTSQDAAVEASSSRREEEIFDAEIEWDPEELAPGYTEPAYVRFKKMKKNSRRITVESNGVLCVANIHDAIEKFTSMPVLRKEVENVEAWFRREEEERAGCDAESAAGAAGKEEAEDVPSQQEEIEQVDCEISDMEPVSMTLDERIETLKCSTACTARRVDEFCLRGIARKLHVRTFKRGSTIAKKGSEGDKMFWVASGCCTCVLDGSEIDKLSRGQCFGEVSMMNLCKLCQGGMLEEEARKQCKRGADILAMEDVVLLELSYQDALPLSRTAPNLWCTLDDICRLRSKRVEARTQGAM